MANRDAPFGLKPVRYRNGTPYSGACTRYWAPSTYATALYVGDPVIHNGDSNDNEVIGQPPGSLQEVVIATAGDGNAITGVIVGFDNITRDSLLYGAASTDRVVLVCDDPNVVFLIQDDGTGTPSADWPGWNANLVAGSGNTTTGLSGWELDANSDPPDADASNQLLIVRLFPALDNEIGDNAIWEVMINQSTFGGVNALGIA